MGIVLRGLGADSPKEVLSNFELEKRIDTTDEWIRTRSGIVSRHIASAHETVISMGANAAKDALRRAGIFPHELDCILMTSTSPAQIIPAGACLLQKKLGNTRAFAFDLQAACSGLLFAIETARALLLSRPHMRYALVVASEKMSAMMNWNDRNTCVLFGDGACAMVLENAPEKPDSFPGCELHSDGTHAEKLQIEAGGSLLPASAETVAKGQHFVTMDGKAIFKLAVPAMAASCESLLKQQGISRDAIRYLVPHQANIRIVDAVAEKLGMRDRVFVNLQHHGNTCAATIGLALHEMQERSLLRPDDLLLLATAGAGLTWGAMLLRWPNMNPAPTEGA